MLEQSAPTGVRAPGNGVLLVEELSQQRLPARALAAVLRQAGYQAHLADFDPRRSGGGEGARAIVALAEALRPRWVIFSILFAGLVPQYLALAEALRRARVNAHISMTGPLPSFAPSELLAACPALDSVLCGEAEASVAGLAAVLGDPTRWRSAPGLACRAPDGSIAQARAWPAQQADLDRLPFPAHDGALPAFRGCRFATVEGSRGCYHSCAFCLPTAFYRAAAGSRPIVEAGRGCHRLRSVGNLVDELELLYRRGAQLFLFDDEQFLPPRPLRAARIAALEQELRRRSLEIAFTIKCRPDDVEPELFRRLQRMGLLRVYVGVESGCQASLNLFGKGTTVERNVEALAALDRLDIVADFYDLLFHPWSTLEGVEADLAFGRRVALTISTPFRFHEVGVLPGTRLAARLKAEGRGSGEPWSVSYALVDPRVEVLRRLNHLLFTASAHWIRTERTLTESWFALLLERRFRPAPSDGARASHLREAVTRLNLECLAVWSDMLEFARAGAIGDAGQVNAAAAQWAGRVHTGCMRATAAAAELGLSTSEAPEMEAALPC
jgi:anaerobic magnesium-protoporphyrin IX monomethyl ester cyclase